MCSFIVLMPSVRFYNVNSHENKEKPLNEKVCPNFWLVVCDTNRLVNPYSTCSRPGWPTLVFCLNNTLSGWKISYILWTNRNIRIGNIEAVCTSLLFKCRWSQPTTCKQFSCFLEIDFKPNFSGNRSIFTADKQKAAYTLFNPCFHREEMT